MKLFELHGIRVNISLVCPTPGVNLKVNVRKNVSQFVIMNIDRAYSLFTGHFFFFTISVITCIRFIQHSSTNGYNITRGEPVDGKERKKEMRWNEWRSNATIFSRNCLYRICVLVKRRPAVAAHAVKVRKSKTGHYTHRKPLMAAE